MLDYLYHVFVIVISCSVPLAFTTLLLSFTFWGIPTKSLMKRIWMFALLNSVILDLLFLIVPVMMRIFNALSIFFIMIIVMFPTLSIKKRSTICLTGLVFYSIAETSVASFLFHFYPNDVVLKSPLILISGYWPLALVLYTIHKLMNQSSFHPGASILSFMKRRRDRKIPLLMFILAAQIFLIIWAICFRVLTDADPIFINTLLIVAAACNMVTIVLVLYIFNQTRNEAVKMTQEYYIDDINRMFTTIRGQRHDFMNHVQVISSFVKMGKMNELERYTQELVGETTEINDIMSIGNPALAALVQAKSTVALAHKIHFIYDCSGMESPSLGVKSIDLIKVLGNLLDNAFDEAKLLPPSKRIVELECKTVQNCLSMTVRNRGTYIPDDVRKKLFQPGFSTKTGEHRGIGLAIVKERLDFYQGTIEVHSSQTDGTAFHIRIPQKKATASR